MSSFVLTRHSRGTKPRPFQRLDTRRPCVSHDLKPAQDERKKPMSKFTSPNNSRRPLMISWDNPVPANSKRMIRQLKNHGRVRKSEPKTTVSLTPYGRTDWRWIRRTIVGNLHPSRGNA